MDKIYTFDSGAVIDLDEVLMIGSPTRNQEYDINLPVYMKGRETPIKLFMYSSLTPPTEDEKKKCNEANTRFVEAWKKWKTRK